MPQRGRIPPDRVAGQAQPQARDLPWNLQIVQAERQATIEVLRQRPTTTQVIELVDNARAGATQIVSTMLARHANVPPIACRAGCVWCCYKAIAVSPPEVLRIAAYLRATLSPADLAAVRERIADLDDQTRSMSSLQREHARLPCALLVDQRCTIYPARPLTCAGWNAVAVNECKAGWLNPEASDKITTNIVQIEAFQAMRLGMDIGSGELGLERDTLELTSALRIALDTPDAVERWLRGERLFAAAHWDDRQHRPDHETEAVAPLCS
jgi:Fe-S-cluster containining protein